MCCKFHNGSIKFTRQVLLRTDGTLESFSRMHIHQIWEFIHTSHTTVGNVFNSETAMPQRTQEKKERKKHGTVSLPLYKNSVATKV